MRSVLLAQVEVSLYLVLIAMVIALGYAATRHAMAAVNAHSLRKYRCRPLAPGQALPAMVLIYWLGQLACFGNDLGHPALQAWGAASLLLFYLAGMALRIGRLTSWRLGLASAGLLVLGGIVYPLYVCVLVAVILLEAWEGFGAITQPPDPEQQPAPPPVPPTAPDILRRAQQEVSVEGTPIASSASGDRTHVLVRPREDLLLLRPSPTMVLVGRGILLAGFFGAVVAILDLLTVGGWAPFLILGIAAVLAVIGLLVCCGSRTHVFDLREGTWTTRSLFERSQVPLAQVYAVQTTPNTLAGGSLELNLVLEGKPLRRVNLTCHADGVATWQTGWYLSQALQVPLLEHAQRPTSPASQQGDPNQPRRAPPRSQRITGWVFAGIGMVALVAGLGLLARSLDFCLRAERVEGTVKALVGRGKNNAAPVVDYDVGGKTYTYDNPFTFYPSTYRVGDKVVLLCRPAAPSACLMQCFPDLWLWPLAGTVGGTLFSVIGLALLRRPVPTTPPLVPAQAPAAALER